MASQDLLSLHDLKINSRYGKIENILYSLVQASKNMNRRISTIMTVAAVAVMAGALFGSSFTSPQIGGSTLEVETSPLAKVANMGGLELVMPEAFASGPCSDLLDSGRPVVNFDLTGVSVDLPTMTGSTYLSLIHI